MQQEAITIYKPDGQRVIITDLSEWRAGGAIRHVGAIVTHGLDHSYYWSDSDHVWRHKAPDSNLKPSEASQLTIEDVQEWLKVNKYLHVSRDDGDEFDDDYVVLEPISHLENNQEVVCYKLTYSFEPRWTERLTFTSLDEAHDELICRVEELDENDFEA